MESTDTATRFAQLERSMRRRFRLVTGALLAVILIVNVAPVAADHLIVRNSDIVDGAVTTPKLRNGSVGTHKLKNGAVGTKKLKDRGVDTPDVRNGAIGTHKLKNGAVGTKKLKDGGVGNADLTNSAVSTTKIRNGSVAAPDIANGAITTNKISPNAQGVIGAGGVVPLNGGPLLGWFNRFGGRPTANRTAPGNYVLTFPGLEGHMGVAVATTIDPGIAVDFRVSGDTILIRTYNFSGVQIDRAFNVLVMAS